MPLALGSVSRMLMLLLVRLLTAPPERSSVPRDVTTWRDDVREVVSLRGKLRRIWFLSRGCVESDTVAIGVIGGDSERALLTGSDNDR